MLENGEDLRAMTQTITREQIIQRALDLRTNHSVDIVKLADSLGIDVYSSGSINESAKISYDPSTGKISICVNESEPITRQRFSVAHEIAHFILHSDQLIQSGCLNRPSDGYTSEMEKEADSLAAQILMPTELVHSYVQDTNMDVEKIDRQEVISIANTFKVSNFVAVIRLRELDYHVPFLDFA